MTVVTAALSDADGVPLRRVFVEHVGVLGLGLEWALTDADGSITFDAGFGFDRIDVRVHCRNSVIRVVDDSDVVPGTSHIHVDMKSRQWGHRAGRLVRKSFSHSHPGPGCVRYGVAAVPAVQQERAPQLSAGTQAVRQGHLREQPDMRGRLSGQIPNCDPLLRRAGWDLQRADAHRARQAGSAAVRFPVGGSLAHPP